MEKIENFIEVMEWRYTTKLYDYNKKVDSEVVEQLKSILRLSPSSINSQPWLFTFIEDAEEKSRFAEASYFNDQKIRDCSVLVVFGSCTNCKMFEKWLGDTQPQGAVDYYNHFVKPLGEKSVLCWFQRQVYIAVGVLLTACGAMRLDSTPMEGFDGDKYDFMLKNEDYKSVAAVAVGYRDENDYNQPSKNPKYRRLLEDIVVTK